MGIPDYYRILRVSPSASQEDVKKAYQQESLKSHPDRFPNATPAEAREHTRRFQCVADAYYILSDRARRAEYDGARQHTPLDPEGDESEEEDSAHFFRSFGDREEQPQPQQMFADVWEDLLRPEVQNQRSVWKPAGTASGAVLGFIMGSMPGAVGGALLGNRLGAIRDAKGKSVSNVFLGLRSDQRAQILKAFAIRVLGSI
ncbi:hypothetical protein MSPP1_001337 [Malassezia sp. CBS 17886]|nr:hypothetical protein MSPP1_001337 [Malassezia sp. CBS 17886]